MRTLFEIIEGAKDGAMPTHEECYWAMLALSALKHFDGMDLMAIYEAAEEGKSSLMLRAKSGYTESWNRFKRALDKSPQEWVGPNNDPANPEYQKMRALAFKVAEKATGEKLR